MNVTRTVVREQSAAARGLLESSEGASQQEEVRCRDQRVPPAVLEPLSQALHRPLSPLSRAMAQAHMSKYFSLGDFSVYAIYKNKV